MDGIECKEVLLSRVTANKDSRIDSAFYTFQIAHNDDLHYEPIGKYLLSTQYGISKDMNTVKKGYPIFRMNELHYGLCDLSTDKYVELSQEEFIEFRLNEADVLFNRTNSYEKVGRTGIYYFHGTPQTFASYLVRLIPNANYILPEYLTAFLNTKMGVQEIRRRSRQSINQTNVNPEEVKKIMIPILGKTFQKYISKMYKLADKYRISSTDEYSRAKTIIEASISIEGIEQYSLSTITEKQLSASFLKTGRLDAEYYQPKYEQITKEINTKDTVLSLCKLYDDTFIPANDIEYKYIELSNVGQNGDISGVELIAGEDLPSRARRKVSKGQIIISSVEGSLESCALIDEDNDGALCSTGFYVLDSDRINSETLLVLFKSEPIQGLMKQRCSGTILTAISKEELQNMPLPYIDPDIQKAIAAKVQESFALRRKSKELLEYAKQAVEMAIEQGEEMATAWLKDKVE